MFLEPRLVYDSASPQATYHFGRLLGQQVEPNAVIGLIGPLGAGKTHLVKGIAAGLDVPEVRTVCSPTFVIVREHIGRMRLYHVDTYRVCSADIAALGFDEMCKAGGLVVVEWADRIIDIMPEDRLTVTLEPTAAQQRRLICLAHGAQSEGLIGRVQRALRE